jgi:hypothetical protein
MQTYLIFTEPRESITFKLAFRRHSLAGLEYPEASMSSAVDVLDLMKAIPNNRSVTKEAFIVNLLFGGRN